MPYAAKAIIQHEFDTDHLNIWIEFRHPMDITVKPADTVWIVELDDVPTAITSSTWLDQFTMLLLINSVGALPDRVTVQYDGPDPLLITTWDKQWEPWAAISSYSGWPTTFKYGMIILWSGTIATIPSGWRLCDGTEGTPDLRNQFIVCADADDAGIAKSTIELTANQTGGVISHFHRVQGSTAANQSGAATTGAGYQVAALSHTHSLSFNSTTTETVPPYYALAYIMKL